MNFALTIVFGWEVTRVAQSGIVLIIQFTLLGMTVVFAFGLWITCKRKLLLLLTGPRGPRGPRGP